MVARAGVAEQGPDVAQVGAGLDQVRGKGVSQRSGRGVLGHAGLDARLARNARCTALAESGWPGMRPSNRG